MKIEGIKKLNDLVNIIESAENIVITSHEDPDGDAIGSIIAIYNILKEHYISINIFKDINIVIKDVPEIFNILSGYSDIKEEYDENIDLLIILDLNESSRLRKIKIFN